MPTTVEKDQIDVDVERPKLISWGAIFAGLVTVVGGSWLMYLFGLAVGVSVVDATDWDAMGDGLGIGAIIWLVLTPVVIYFVAAMLTARLTGKTDNTVGMLHGITLWAAGTTVTLILGYMGVSGLMQTGQAFIGTVASTTFKTVSTAGAGAVDVTQAVGSGLGEMADTQFGEKIQARLKRQAAEVIAAADQSGGADVRANEVTRAIDQLDSEALSSIATHLIAGDQEKAKGVLRNQTPLNDRQIEAIIAGVSQDIQEALGVADNDQNLAEDIKRELRRATAGYLADLDERGEPEVTQAEVSSALRDLDADTLAAVSVRLLQGDAERAKDLLALRTSLSEREVQDIVDGVEADISQTIAAYREQAEETLEAAVDYTQAVIWTAFGTMAMALAVSIFGGWMGTEATRQIEVARVRHTARHEA